MENREDLLHDDLLKRAVDAVLRDPIPSELPPERVRQLVAVVQRAANRPHPITLIQRIKNMRTMTKIAVAASVLIAFFGLVSWLVPGGGTALAFTDVAEALNGIHTATWKTTQVFKRPQGEAQTTTGVGMFMAPSHERMEKGASSIVIFDGQKNQMVTHIPKTKRAMVVKLKNSPGSSLGRTFINLRETIAEARSGKDGNVERLGIETIDGRRAEVFRIRFQNAEMKTFGETKIWADPKTSLPVRVEKRSGRGENEFHMVMTDFQVGVDLDPALFSIEVPEGYTVQQTQLDLSKGPLSIVAETLGMAAEENGGVFPTSLRGEQGIDGILERAIANRWKQYGIDVDKDLCPLPDQDVGKLTKENLEELQKAILEIGMKLPAAMAALHAIRKHGDWHYAGKDVKLGAPHRPIFWSKFRKSYHVIYADLSVKEVPPQDVPKVPQSEGSPQQ
ncbi:MAG: outer membrane lipoprotein carrier protein LolA [Planctomycetes bacterium]|nr:outer membrane lipoprotein carrier protein LolA [Planctomycetota bacterium]